MTTCLNIYTKKNYLLMLRASENWLKSSWKNIVERVTEFSGFRGKVETIIFYSLFLWTKTSIFYCMSSVPLSYVEYKLEIFVENNITFLFSIYEKKKQMSAEVEKLSIPLTTTGFSESLEPIKGNHSRCLLILFHTVNQTSNT